MGLFSKKVETRQQFIVPSELVGQGNFADMNPVTPDSALRLSSVWACISLLANTISTLPLDVFRNDEEIPAPPLLASPAAGWTLEQWLWAIMQSLLLRGNAYSLITARSGPRRAGQPRQHVGERGGGRHRHLQMERPTARSLRRVARCCIPPSRFTSG